MASLEPNSSRELKAEGGLGVVKEFQGGQAGGTMLHLGHLVADTGQGQVEDALYFCPGLSFLFGGIQLWE